MGVFFLHVTRAFFWPLLRVHISLFLPVRVRLPLSYPTVA